MIEWLQTMCIAIGLAGIFVGYTVMFAVVAKELDQLVRLIGSKRKTRKFFKQIEEYRRDFA